MLARGIAMIAVICLLSQPLSAEPARPDDRAADQPAADMAGQGPDLPFEPAGDILAGREAGAHAATLRQIAIYASIDNREGVEILTAQLRAMGVSVDVVTEAVIWVKLHGSSPDRRSGDASDRCWAPPLALSSEATQ
jgi:hypothetical protein